MEQIILTKNQIQQEDASCVAQELTGVRNYNPDLDMMESAWIDAQYNELTNGFAL